MKCSFLSFILCIISSCNHIETGETLSKQDVKRIQELNLLNDGEKIYKFYSEYKKKNAGNFFTDKRIAKYWIDDREKEKNQAVFAFYNEIKAMDTVYNPGATYSPYILVTKSDNTQFKVSAGGKREDVRSFFEGAISQWRLHVK